MLRRFRSDRVPSTNYKLIAIQFRVSIFISTCPYNSDSTDVKCVRHNLKISVTMQPTAVNIRNRFRAALVNLFTSFPYTQFHVTSHGSLIIATKQKGFADNEQPPCLHHISNVVGVKRLGRGVIHLPPSSAEVKERVDIYLYSPSGPSWPVLGRTLPLPLRLFALLSFFS